MTKAQPTSYNSVNSSCARIRDCRAHRKRICSCGILLVNISSFRCMQTAGIGKKSKPQSSKHLQPLFADRSLPLLTFHGEYQKPLLSCRQGMAALRIRKYPPPEGQRAHTSTSSREPALSGAGLSGVGLSPQTGLEASVDMKACDC